MTASVFAEVVAALRMVTGEDALWAATIDPATRLDGDLLLDSIELAALSGLLRERHGDRVDLAGYVAGLDIDRIIELTVGDVSAYVAAGGQPR